MDLSKKDRVLLANQYLILEKLYPENAKGYQDFRKALENGYRYHYEDIIEWFCEELPEEQSKEIFEILDMFRALTFSFQKLNDKDGLEEEKIKFKGFDGNNESQLSEYIRYLIIDLGLYQELRYGMESPDYKSGMPMLDTYLRMLGKWKTLSKEPDLSAQQIKEILTERFFRPE